MKRRAFCVVLLLAALSLTAASYGPKKGSLVIVGGGALTLEITSRFVSLAGGEDADFVVIPTASGDQGLDLARVEKSFLTQFKVKHVTVLHTRDPKKANSKEFADQIGRASCRERV